MRFSTDALLIGSFIFRDVGLVLPHLNLEETSAKLGFSDPSRVANGLQELFEAEVINVSFSLEAAVLTPGKRIGELKVMTSKVFIVHGHNGEMRFTLEAFLRKLGLKPIIISDTPSLGKSIIEMIEVNGDVQYAIVLLTPDDRGGINNESAALLARARQNVILELGYFCGRLGRSRVLAVHKGDVEVPSDYHGVIYVKADTPGTDWRMEVAKNLKSAGLNIDVESLFLG